jgi:probable HAF family extracellular repeat protein
MNRQTAGKECPVSRSLFLFGLLAVAACENPAAPDRALPDITEAPVPPPSRKIVAASSVMDIGTPAGSARSVQAFDVNEGGNIAGFWVNPGEITRGFSWSASGGFTTLKPVGNLQNSYAFKVSDNGRVAGISQSSSGANQATIWTNGNPVSIGGLAPNGESLGMSINAWGSATGSATVAGGAWRGFYYSSVTRQMQSVGVFPGGTYTMGQDINDWGQVVGYGNSPQGDRAFLYNVGDGTLRNLGTIPGGTSSYALSINSSAQVVGFAFGTSGYPHGFLWDGHAMIDLGTLGGPQSVAFGINDAGEVVGYSQVPSGEFHAFVWTAESGMVDLGTLPGGTVSYAQQINTIGLTAGIALDSNGNEHAVIWNVVLQ